MRLCLHVILILKYEDTLLLMSSGVRVDRELQHYQHFKGITSISDVFTEYHRVGKENSAGRSCSISALIAISLAVSLLVGGQ